MLISAAANIKWAIPPSRKNSMTNTNPTRRAIRAIIVFSLSKALIPLSRCCGCNRMKYLAHVYLSHVTNTAAPLNFPARKSASASFACCSG